VTGPVDDGRLVEGREETLRKCYRVLEAYGKVYGAERFVECKSCHWVTSCGLRFVKSMFMVLEGLASNDLKSRVPLTANPRPPQRSIPLVEKLVGRYLYSKQRRLESLLLRLGLIDPDAFTCTPYYIGNKPSYGDILAWAESSAVIYANSVLGARTNRNSSIVELLSGVTGETPLFGLLLDENRKANWLVEVRTSSKPSPFILGSLIGKSVLDGVPYIVGLDKWEFEEYELKDMGAAMAVWGAVGLFHAENLTPEAVENGRKILRGDHKVLRVGDEELSKMKKEMEAKAAPGKPDLAIIGCPHLSREQLDSFARELSEAELKTRTLLLAAPKIVREFKSTKLYSKLRDAGGDVDSFCPLMLTNIPTSKRLKILTNSGKLSYYSHAVFMDTPQLLSYLRGE